MELQTVSLDKDIFLIFTKCLLGTSGKVTHQIANGCLLHTLTNCRLI
jgi:hypothetical protein